MSKGIIGGMDDDVWMVVSVGSAVGADEVATAVGIANPDGWFLRRCAAPRHDAYPGLVGEYRTALSDKDRLRQAVGHVRDPRARIAVERAVNDVEHRLAVDRDRLGNGEIEGIGRRPVPGTILAGIRDVMGVREKNGRTERDWILRVVRGPG